MIDPRANSLEKLEAPTPLPHVSRRALKRVKNPRDIPTECPYCGGSVTLVENSVIYRGRTYGDWPYAYLCKPCDAFVGLHPDTDIPLGTLADKPLREARKKSKAHFHEWMGMGRMTRSEAYAWLAEKMNIPTEVCHFGWFDERQCEEANDHCYNAIVNKVNF